MDSPSYPEYCPLLLLWWPRQKCERGFKKCNLRKTKHIISVAKTAHDNRCKAAKQTKKDFQNDPTHAIYSIS